MWWQGGWWQGGWVHLEPSGGLGEAEEGASVHARPLRTCNHEFRGLLGEPHYPATGYTALPYRCILSYPQGMAFPPWPCPVVAVAGFPKSQLCTTGFVTCRYCWTLLHLVIAPMHCPCIAP